MKRTLLLLTSASLVLAFSVALPLLGVATDLSASQLNLASPQLLAGATILCVSFVLLARSRRTTKQVVATRARRCRNP
jgi:hypothetical protein